MRGAAVGCARPRAWVCSPGQGKVCCRDSGIWSSRTSCRPLWTSSSAAVQAAARPGRAGCAALTARTTRRWGAWWQPARPCRGGHRSRTRSCACPLRRWRPETARRRRGLAPGLGWVVRAIVNLSHRLGLNSRKQDFGVAIHDALSFPYEMGSDMHTGQLSISSKQIVAPVVMKLK